MNTHTYKHTQAPLHADTHVHTHKHVCAQSHSSGLHRPTLALVAYLPPNPELTSPVWDEEHPRGSWGSQLKCYLPSLFLFLEGQFIAEE